MMWRETCAALLVIFGIVWCFVPVRSEDKSGKNQQTFVVRYKSGEQTIPVTVVLDYKKQTEYVINMSPRTSAKSVTLYDFKQRTIAYKDLTNRECFLGRLTHENLNEETDALNRVQNPVEHKPKILSLDPHRTALTPTEIRNMAGQKTAVFCRKMNTWLILPQQTHSIQKRDVDDEEIDERTYHRHGYHTVRYSHYGHETRRRFRNSNRNASRQLSHRNKDASKILEIGNSEFEERVLPQHLPHIKTPVSHSNTFSGSEPREIGQNSFVYPQHHQNYQGHHQQHPQKEETRTSTLSPIHQNSNYEQNPLHRDTHKLPRTGTRPLISEVEHSDINSHALSSLFDNTDVLPVRNSSFESYLDPLSVDPTLPSENLTEPKAYPEPSFYNPEIQEPNFYSPGKSEREPNSIDRHNQIETESFSNELLPASHGKPYTEFDDEHAVPVSQDVSSNVIEIPKIAKKFENLDLEQDPGVVAQTNEDLHDVFEGFYNLRGNYPPSDRTNFHNSFFIPSETNQFREHSIAEKPLIQNNPILSHSVFRNVTGNDLHRRENVLSSIPRRISSTDSPTLPTITPDYNRISTVYSNPIIDAVTTAYDSQSGGASSHKAVPQQFVQNYANGRSGKPLKSFPASAGIFYEENSVNSIPTTYSPTLAPFRVHSVYGNGNLRSDIPSESDQDEDIESYTTKSTDSNQLNGNNQSPSVVPTAIVKEGISFQQQRFHNVLRQYKPDQIIIDIEKIPTERPPGSISGFQSRDYPSTETPIERSSSNPIRTTNSIRNEPLPRETWRSSHSEGIGNPSRRRNNLQTSGMRTHRRNNILTHPRRNEPNQFPQLQQVNNIRQLSHSNRHNFPNRFNNHPNSFGLLHPQLDPLPPGVSIHPRHPKAPYADIFHPNVLPPINQENNFRTLKPHRQRHHRKKDRFQQHSCCKASGKGDGKLSSCCRAGGSCCSGNRDGKRIPSKTACCSDKNSRNPQVRITNTFPSQYVNGRSYSLPSQHGRSNTLPPQQHLRTVEDIRNRCEKQKMCRTLYESTQQVMVCRNAEIEGC